jgi:hypothetical protein
MWEVLVCFVLEGAFWEFSLWDEMPGPGLTAARRKQKRITPAGLLGPNER